MLRITIQSAVPMILFVLFISSDLFGQSWEQLPSYEQYIREVVPTKEEIDVFLHEMSFFRFDHDVGYVLGNYLPRSGMDGSSAITTIQKNGARRSFFYSDRLCRINTYGNSYTQCSQVNDGETWQEYLAAHLGEPVRNFGVGGFGVYQAYRRMIREEKTRHGAEYVMLYIWGDDSIRSLLRCRYAYTKSWNERTNRREGIGRMFHGNFWAHIEMDMETGKLVEEDNLLSTPESLYKMTDPDWMYEVLKDDWALQMFLYRQKQISEVNTGILRKLSEYLDCPIDLTNSNAIRESVYRLLDEYSFEATKYILDKAKKFTSAHGKELMIVLFNPGRVAKQLMLNKTRYDQEIVDFLQDNDFNYFDMDIAHVEDYKNFDLSINDYFKRFFIGHYSPAGNHFFAYSIKDRIVEWLDPKPITYQDDVQKMRLFKEYYSGK